jgi:hypothetical protein
MKTIGLQIVIGLLAVFGSATASADAIHAPKNNRAEAAEEQISSRGRCACRWQRPHHRVAGVHKGYYKSKFVYSNYAGAPWYSRNYFPRWRDYYRKPIVVVYRQ